MLTFPDQVLLNLPHRPSGSTGVPTDDVLCIVSTYDDDVFSGVEIRPNQITRLVTNESDFGQSFESAAIVAGGTHETLTVAARRMPGLGYAIPARWPVRAYKYKRIDRDQLDMMTGRTVEYLNFKVK